MQIIAQHVEQALHRRGIDDSALAVHIKPDRGPSFAQYCWFALAHRAAISSFAASPAKRSSGRRGIALNATPVASRMAFRIAGAGPSWGNSPIPLAPNPP